MLRFIVSHIPPSLTSSDLHCRLKALHAAFANVQYIILDEMSMVPSPTCHKPPTANRNPPTKASHHPSRLNLVVQVGRRSLGQIDELLRQAKGCEEPFGGISIILVGEIDTNRSIQLNFRPATCSDLFECVFQCPGDHGQLPPVKDHRTYDWAGVR